MTDAALLTGRFNRALLYANHVHGGQVRKRTSIPYIAHLLAVAATVLEYGGAEDTRLLVCCMTPWKIRAGSLASQTFVTASVIKLRISSAPVRILSSTRQPVNRKKIGTFAKQLTLNTSVWSIRTLLVSLSDKVHNARSILRDLRKPEIGNAVWNRFKTSKKDTLWYYRELANVFKKHLPGQLANELSEIVDVLEKE